MSFYLKLTDEQAEIMISRGIDEIFGKEPERFAEYTYAIEDVETGEKYWCVDDYGGHEIKNWVNETYPTLEKYNYDFVKNFIKEPEDG